MEAAELGRPSFDTVLDVECVLLLVRAVFSKVRSVFFFVLAPHSFD